ncbi:hypothetical protein [Legionella sp. 16cNR16C]|uniref:hypothetical protein n=1 Tax=Legionella sp. 16cNR16C TaxID=2905656 RepID=UPI001E58EC33|nr:hypothetical protein [Legionella sp. 16cNR16C]MCE3046413.1 hypothetical protein [Legionella sp. 16cNR16C]
MKNPMAFFAATAKELDRLERFKTPANHFTVDDYRQTADLYTSAREISGDCPEEVKADIEKAKAELFESILEIINLKFVDANIKLTEANKIMDCLNAYLKDNKNPDYSYTQSQFKLAKDIGIEGLKIESEKIDFKNQLFNVNAELLCKPSDWTRAVLAEELSISSCLSPL